MILRKYLILIPALLSSFLPALAQKQESSTMRFTASEWNFGQIKEVDGPVAHTFTFTNTGDEALVIESVSVSCGCTTPSFPRTPVLPGRTGEVKITYDPAGRPGAFAREVYITSRSGANRNKLIIRGSVIGRPRTIEEDYTFKLERGVRLSALSANFSYVEQGAPVSMTVGVANSSRSAVKLGISALPADGLLTVSAPEVLCPGCRADITLTYRIPHGGYYGRMSHTVTLTVDDKPVSDKITVSGVAVERFDDAQTQVPSLAVLPAVLEMGGVPRGQARTGEVALKNEGTAPLIIRAVEHRPGIASDLAAGTRILPGESLTVNISVNGSNRGAYSGGIVIITNDPARPMRELRVVARIL